ncbi:hypothetical protein R1X32_09175 (plasmid) [Rhodococcus opacus]|uniref:hypothetical protein n=1 Tax=Rhodococcus opacus TaxID=37919 RepID=UPI0002A2C120|nr:hypothetical protein [Rhodococcus opacus]ELB86582.1 hypothetical protein Rwratislav_44136 [Rhodococcus wratislaviensis IFP 2016]MDV6247792.1 hypothetical protein [Rhodococcus opacus]WKN59872.1 hypothetical protein HJ581_0039130 [Rhodococcus opacus]
MTSFYIDASGEETPLPSKFGQLTFFKDHRGALFVLARDEDGIEIGVTWRRKGDWSAAFNRMPGSSEKLDLLLADGRPDD